MQTHLIALSERVSEREGWGWNLKFDRNVQVWYLSYTGRLKQRRSDTTLCVVVCACGNLVHPVQKLMSWQFRQNYGAWGCVWKFESLVLLSWYSDTHRNKRKDSLTHSRTSKKTSAFVSQSITVIIGIKWTPSQPSKKSVLLDIATCNRYCTATMPPDWQHSNIVVTVHYKFNNCSSENRLLSRIASCSKVDRHCSRSVYPELRHVPW